MANTEEQESYSYGFQSVLRELTAVAAEALKQQEKVTLELRKQQEEFQLERREYQDRQNELILRLQNQQEAFQEQQEQEKREKQERQEQERQERMEVQKRQDLCVAKIFEVVNQQKEELSFFRTGGSMGRNLSPIKGEEGEVNDDLRAGIDGGDGGGNDYGNSEGNIKSSPDKIRLTHTQRKQQQQKSTMTTRSRADKSEFDSLQELESGSFEESADSESTVFFLSPPGRRRDNCLSMEAHQVDTQKRKQENANSKVTLFPSKKLNKRIKSKVHEKMKKIAEEIYELRTNKVESNIIHIKEVMSKYPDEFAPIIALCPKFDIILAHMLVFRLGVRVQEVDWTSDMKDWNEEDCRRVGRAMATFIRMVQTGLMAVDAWRRHYVQLSNLFDEIEGFEDFMIAISKNLLRDNKFGMIFRVGIGAALSMSDAATDIYVISTYYGKEELVGQANVFLAMIILNIFVQMVVVKANYQQSGWRQMLREFLITLMFLRPAVDAYRVATSKENDLTVTDPLHEVSC